MNFSNATDRKSVHFTDVVECRSVSRKPTSEGDNPDVAADGTTAGSSAEIDALRAQWEINILKNRRGLTESSGDEYMLPPTAVGEDDTLTPPANHHQVKSSAASSSPGRQPLDFDIDPDFLDETNGYPQSGLLDLADTHGTGGDCLIQSTDSVRTDRGDLSHDSDSRFEDSVDEDFDEYMMIIKPDADKEAFLDTITEEGEPTGSYLDIASGSR